MLYEDEISLVHYMNGFRGGSEFTIIQVANCLTNSPLPLYRFIKGVRAEQEEWIPFKTNMTFDEFCNGGQVKAFNGYTGCTLKRNSFKENCTKWLRKKYIKGIGA